MLTKNRFSSYILYGIGEVLLVVIGILIALKVNNFNEIQKQDTKITGALKEIHRDLSEDIKESNGLISNYSHEDSLINILMTKKISIEDFKGAQGFMFANAATTLHTLNINDNGYELLKANSDNMLKKYQPLLKSLKKIYIDDKKGLELTGKISTDIIIDYFSRNVQNTEWFNDLFYNGNLTPKAIDFFRNDPYFKNHMTQYQGIVINNHYEYLHQFRIDAEKCYQELTKILQLEDLIASDSTYYNIDVKDYEHFVGTYKKDSTATVIISMETDKLFYQWGDEKKARIFPISKSSFVHQLYSVFNNIVLDSTGQVHSYNIHIGKDNISMKKTD